MNFIEEKPNMDEFNEKIIQAFATKVQRSEAKISELEQNLGVKEAELNYLAKLYDKEKSLLSLERENSKNEISILKKKIKKINQLISEKEEKIKELENDFTNIISSKDEEISKLKTDLNNKIENLNESLSQKEADFSSEIQLKEKTIEEQKAQIEKLESELNELKVPESLASDLASGGRLKCAQCGALGKNIKVVEDKTKPLSYMGNIPMYAKINVCKKCGYEF